MNFFSKFILPYFESHLKLCLFKEILSYLQTDATLSANNSQHCCVLFARSSIHTFLWTYQIWKQLYSIPSKNECVLSWLTNVAVAGVLIYIKYINIFLVSTKSPFKLLDPPIVTNQRSRKEKLLQGRMCTIVRATQNFLGSFSWSNGKTTSRRRNGTGTRILWIRIWILPERPLPLPLDKGYASRLWGRDSYLFSQIVNMNRVETSMPNKCMGMSYPMNPYALRTCAVGASCHVLTDLKLNIVEFSVFRYTFSYYKLQIPGTLQGVIQKSYLSFCLVLQTC